jgi:hypothetical protein
MKLENMYGAYTIGTAQVNVTKVANPIVNIQGSNNFGRFGSRLKIMGAKMIISQPGYKGGKIQQLNNADFSLEKCWAGSSTKDEFGNEFVAFDFDRNSKPDMIISSKRRRVTKNDWSRGISSGQVNIFWDI